MLPPPVSKTTSPRKENVVAGSLGSPADGASSRTVKVKVPWKFPRARVPRVQSPNGLVQPAVNRTESKLAKYRLHCAVASASWPVLVAMTAPNPINQAGQGRSDRSGQEPKAQEGGGLPKVDRGRCRRL